MDSATMMRAAASTSARVRERLGEVAEVPAGFDVLASGRVRKIAVVAERSAEG
jgi:hypothetical protein